MKILQCSGLAGPSEAAGGVWRVLNVQAESVESMGHEVQVFSGWLGRLPKLQGQQRDALVRVRRPFPKAGLRGLWSLRMFSLFLKHAASVDVVHMHLCRDFFTTSLTIFCWLLKIPVVAQTHGMVQPSRSSVIMLFDRLVFTRVLRVPRMFLYLTPQEVTDLRALGVEDTRCKAIENASPVSNADTARATSSRIIFASRLHSRKRPQVFVDAASMVLHRGLDAQFAICGVDQGELPNVTRRIDELGFGDKIQILGPLSHSDLQDLLGNSLALVLPSIEEPYPMVVLEASALGVPTILSSSCGISKLMNDNSAALVVEPSASEVASAMCRLISDREFARDLGRRARALHTTVWSPTRLATELNTVYSSVVESRA